jgi:hypothetical protein
MKKIFFLIVSFLTLGAISYGLFAQFPEQMTPEESKKLIETIEKSYFDVERQLSDLVLDDEDAGKVIKISLENFNEDAVLVHQGKNTLSTLTQDPILLSIVQQACSPHYLLRPHTCSTTAGGGYGGPYILGTLKIITTKRKLNIYITGSGFQFEKGPGANLSQRFFYSWALAKVLDDMVYEARSPNHEHISWSLFHALSGESIVDLNKEIYWEARVKMQKDIMPDDSNVDEDRNRNLKNSSDKGAKEGIKQ